ncbi:MAG: hypothetical protein A2086_00245 [Spirochaetes bacterium GWD1_27_9]|nr:MAG: hypothetical protein A2Z98_00330 [Spirochaetes bacterium GWB1_27_13]OHD27887.1 MAG: hypothetical protein A2Y34_14590 [Spirochaetes bacterium GWC1_27_15]OHD32662.1 MAG: hypothetical protein A2086_00245 [Spirochaetes bacterium GWD1_27_9]
MSDNVYLKKEIQQLDLYQLISGPMTALIEAECQAAQATAEFIERVGFTWGNLEPKIDITEFAKYLKAIQTEQTTAFLKRCYKLKEISENKYINKLSEEQKKFFEKKKNIYEFKEVFTIEEYNNLKLEDKTNYLEKKDDKYELREDKYEKILNAILKDDNDEKDIEKNFHLNPLLTNYEKRRLWALIENINNSNGKDNKKEIIVESFGLMRMVSFYYDRFDEFGNSRRFKVEVPLLSLIPIPVIQVKTAELEFNFKMTHKEEKKFDGKLKDTNDNKDDESYLNLKRTKLYGFIAKSNYNQQDPSFDDKKIKLKITLEQADMPDGINQLLNITSKVYKSTEVKSEEKK